MVKAFLKVKRFWAAEIQNYVNEKIIKSKFCKITLF